MTGGKALSAYRQPTEAAATRRLDMPLPQDLKTLILAGILGLLTLAALFFASEIVLPIVFALVLHLLLQPAMRLFVRLHVPRAVAALLMIAVFFCSVTALALALSGPAAEWIAKVPESLPRLEQRLSMFTKPVADVKKASQEVDRIAEGPATDARPITVNQPGLSSFLFSSTRAFLMGGLVTVILLFYLLVSGDLFLRRVVEILPTFANKRQAVGISREIESNISQYLVTISVMNAGVGLAAGLACYVSGLSDPILWGCMAFLVNYVPVIGPLFGAGVLFLAGLQTFEALWPAFIPVSIYFAIHLVEGEIVTPMLLARRFTLNPVLVIVALVFWYWMWGVAGAVLAVPMLATVKIVADRITPLMALGHFLGGDVHGSERG